MLHGWMVMMLISWILICAARRSSYAGRKVECANDVCSKMYGASRQKFQHEKQTSAIVLLSNTLPSSKLSEHGLSSDVCAYSYMT